MNRIIRKLFGSEPKQSPVKPFDFLQIVSAGRVYEILTETDGMHLLMCERVDISELGNGKWKIIAEFNEGNEQ